MPTHSGFCGSGGAGGKGHVCMYINTYIHTYVYIYMPIHGRKFYTVKSPRFFAREGGTRRKYVVSPISLSLFFAQLLNTVWYLQLFVVHQLVIP